MIKNILNKIKISKREITLIIISMMVIILFFSGFSIGKGFFETDIKTSAEIAEPILMVENNPKININEKDNIGSYEFKVKNFNEKEKITETDLKYNIEIISKIYNNIKIKIYKDGEEIAIENNKTQYLYFNKNIKQEHNYRLEITYNQDEKIDTRDIFQDIQIKVHSEQTKT